MLRVKSARGARKLLTENYQIEHIITTWQRAAFSESAQFREILLVARKLKKIGSKGKICNDTHHCNVAVLKRLPASLEESKEFATKIKAVAISSSETYEDANMVSYKVTQRQLRALADNLFTLISVQAPSLIDLWMKLLTKAKARLSFFHDYVEDVKAEVREGIESRRGGRVQFLTILADESMAIKKSDVWIATKVLTDSLIVKHRFLNVEMQIPLKSVYRALRRISGIRNMDVSDKLDYVISGKFPKLEEFLKLSIGKTDTRFIDKWKNYVKERLANFVVVRRMDISAPGSSLLAFYSSIPVAPPGITWALTIASEDDAKILTMWFNSSINILQTLINRKETRGAFLQVDKYTLEEFQILDPRRLSKLEKSLLLSTFQKQKIDLPSILDQLKMKKTARIEIDKAVFKVLGFGDDEIDRILDYLYPALAKEIEQLKTLMQG